MRMFMSPKLPLLLVALGTVGLAPPQPVAAQSWPARTVSVVVPFSAGNANDVQARIVLDQVQRQVGQPLVIENRPGAGGTTGVAAVARSAPDGYTILVHSSSFSSAYAIYKNLPYDTFADFVAATPIGVQPTVLVVSPSKGYKTVADLVAAAKARPGELNFASAGIGAASHLAAERFRVAAGFTAQHIPFRGPTEAMTEVMAGRIDYYFLPIAPALPLIKQGKLLALAVSSAQRAPSLPDVPTTAEAGLRDAAYNFWAGLFVPAKTPREVIMRLHEETQKALQVPAVREKLASVGVGPLQMDPETFDKYFRDDVLSTAKLVKDAGVPQQSN
jgi:tripartite-type tricarboxylate transporter receptor subunit TctC